MADVELIVKLDTETYKAACDLGVSYFVTGMRSGKTLLSKLAFAIRKGTPLPKGHGKLKDADAICKDIISALGIRDENYLLEAEKAVYKRIKNAPTIIKADKESKK